MKTCPMCGEFCEDLLLWRRKGNLIKTCFECKEDSQKLNTEYYDRAKKRVEEERKKNNSDVLRSYKIKP